MMDRADVAFWISIVGATVAVGLAMIKVYEFVSGILVRITAEPWLTSSEDIGNTIVLLNKSSVPVCISYFDLVWIQPRSLFGWNIPFTWKVVSEDSPIEASIGYHQSIPAHGTHSLDFSDQDHFDWGDHLKQDIYLRLSLTGRHSPLWFRIWRARK
jgi:hypothetical protein